MAKTKFPCGHKGKGKFCHRCAEAAKPPKEPELCKKCGKWIGDCDCNDLFGGMTVGEFRGLQDKMFEETMESIRADRFYQSVSKELEEKKP